MTNNDQEITLLTSDPKALIVKYQCIIEIIVSKFIKSGSILLSDKDEFVQVINERLLLSSEKIKNQYKGASLLKTYFSTIIRNICLEEINKKNRYSFTDIESVNQVIVSDSSSNEEFYLNDEFDRLSKIIKMYNTKAPKLILCSKLIYRIRITISDFKKYCIKFKDDKIKMLIGAIDQTKNIPEFELFQIITPYVNKCDNQINKPDALRKWLKRKMDEIIELMNGNPPRANYDKETLQILFEKYFSKKSE